MEERKIKADVVIIGNLLSARGITSNPTGGGNLYLQIDKSTLGEFFDIEGACVIEGDVKVENFNAADKTVVVCGWAAAKGGDHE